MRKLFFITLFFNFALALLPWSPNMAHAQVNPWPWAKPLPFPWNKIEGTWTDHSSNFGFSFKVIENSWGVRHIKIRQFDYHTGRIIAEGQGSEQSDEIVVAAMTGGQQSQYLLTIRLLANVFCYNDRNVTGVTMESYDHQLLNHFEIHKTGEMPLTPRKDQDYKLTNAETSGTRFHCLEEKPLHPNDDQ